MFQVFLSTYPWDLLDEGVEAVLGRLAGEIGLSGVCAWASVPGLTHLRVREVEPRVFSTRGGLFFRPDEAKYSPTRCKPIVSGWVKARDPLAQVAEACARQGLSLRVIVSATRTGRIARRHPEMACKNAFGVVSHHSVCTVNPDVQSYLCCMAADLSEHYELEGIALADFMPTWSEAVTTDLCLAEPLGETEKSLLGTCFCESCQQSALGAGVDVDSACRYVRTSLHKSLDGRGPTESEAEATLSETEPLSRYFVRRGSELSSLMKRLMSASTCPVLLDRCIGEGDERHGHDTDPSTPAGLITRIDRPDQLESAFAAGAGRNELRLPASFLAGHEPAQVVSILSQAAEMGFSGAQVDNYGLLPDSMLNPLKQAIRFVRRSSG